ncbi:uncharacterized protein LOC134539397 [Bacillus rossius redtenbacheri]|uniref:uncharacterized protein LOC134539397 n=1 Tax=Bacillus rossius redtenbacheri TaxID=93214 RepID=UPI002FDD7A04
MAAETSSRPQSSCVLGKVRLAVALAALAALLGSCGPARADDGGFFLKAAKSLPRIGRRGDLDFFLKAAKSVPRIGRRGFTAAEGRDFGDKPWYRTMDTVIRPSRRSDPDPELTWDNLDEALEARPELLQLLSKDAGLMPRDGPDYGRQRRRAAGDRELPEARLQPEV